jgi:hypothetical protein
MVAEGYATMLAPGRYQLAAAATPWIAIVLGSSVEYTVSEVADRKAGVVAKPMKDRLAFK